MLFPFRTPWTRRLLAFALIAPLITLIAMGVHQLGDCSGGYKTPFRCEVIPDRYAEYSFNTLFIGIFVSLVWLPGWALIALIVEIWARR